MAADGGCEMDVVHRMNEGIKAKKCLHEGVIVATELHGAEAWGYETCWEKESE